MSIKINKTSEHILYIAAPSDDKSSQTSQGKQFLYHQSDLNTAIQYNKIRISFEKTVRHVCKWRPLRWLYKTIPILYWLPKYKWKKYISGDIIAGITVAILNIPQGMAYGLLGNVPPVVGIYMAIFPVFVYLIFGTSRHVSLGTFGVVCLITGNVASFFGSDEYLASGGGVGKNKTFNPKFGPNFPLYTNLQVATTVTFVAAIIHCSMYILHLGIVINLLSETMVNSLTCACSFHVVVAQFKDLFGLPITKRSSYFSLPLGVYDAASAIPRSNHAAVYMSFFCVLFMLTYNEIIKPRVAKKTKIPIPIELLVVIVGTTSSYLCNFEKIWNISIVGEIPTGFPEPELPKFALIPYIFKDAVIIALISYAITMSMALLVAKKGRYRIDGNQELLAMGLANFVGSMLSCMPISASLARTVIQQNVGGVSQLASLVFCLILLVVLLWIAPVFTFLPRCFLASIIIVALKALYMQITNLPKFWRRSKWDGVLWLATFLLSALVAIDVGLCSGILISIINIAYHGQNPYSCLMGVIPDTDLYVDLKRYRSAEEVTGIKIFHYAGSLNFATIARFKRMLLKNTGFKIPKYVSTKSTKSLPNIPMEDNEEELIPVKCIIVDFSALIYIDPSGVSQLKSVQYECKDKNVALYIAGCSVPVYEIIRKCEGDSNKDTHMQMFPRVHDAVMFAKLTVLSSDEL